MDTQTDNWKVKNPEAKKDKTLTSTENKSKVSPVIGSTSTFGVTEKIYSPKRNNQAATTAESWSVLTATSPPPT